MILAFDLWATLGTWGGVSVSASNVANRQTRLHPAKSSIVGLVGAARGTGKTDLPALAERLLVATRTDAQPRIAFDDYEATERVSSEGGQRATRFEEVRRAYAAGVRGAILSRRQYWSAGGWTVFLSDREGDDGFLRDLHSALRQPVWPVHAGRRCCPLALPPDPVLAPCRGLSETATWRPPACERHAHLRDLPLGAWNVAATPYLRWEPDFPGAPRAMRSERVPFMPEAVPLRGSGAGGHRAFREIVELSAPFPKAAPNAGART